MGDYVDCQILSGSNSKRKLYISKESFRLSKDNPQVTIEVSAPFDCSSHTSDTTIIMYECIGDLDFFYQTMSNAAIIQVTDRTSSAMCKDPHIVQIVRGLDEDNEMVSRLLCYDFYGEAGQGYELVSDNILGNINTLIHMLE